MGAADPTTPCCLRLTHFARWCFLPAPWALDLATPWQGLWDSSTPSQLAAGIPGTHGLGSRGEVTPGDPAAPLYGEVHESVAEEQRAGRGKHLCEERGRPLRWKRAASGPSLEFT